MCAARHLASLWSCGALLWQVQPCLRMHRTHLIMGSDRNGRKQTSGVSLVLLCTQMFSNIPKIGRVCTESPEHRLLTNQPTPPGGGRSLYTFKEPANHFSKASHPFPALWGGGVGRGEHATRLLEICDAVQCKICHRKVKKRKKVQQNANNELHVNSFYTFPLDRTEKKFACSKNSTPKEHVGANCKVTWWFA